MKAMSVNNTGSVCSGTWSSEGHSITFVLLDDGHVSIVEAFRGDSWKRVGRNWSTNRKVELDEAIKEQNKIVKYGYKKVDKL